MGLERKNSSKKEQAKLREAHITHPWDGTSMTWKWQAGRWRWGWDTLSVEEWTGPAVWTDAVVSYLYATAGVRPEDLSRLKGPVQIRDVVVVPSEGFNPVAGRKEGVSRLVHLFRGVGRGDCTLPNDTSVHPCSPTRESLSDQAQVARDFRHK